MSSEIKYVDIQLQMWSIVCQMEGMKVANTSCEHAGYTPAYDEVAFCELSDRLDALRESLK